jgi:exonuclease SbcD
MRILHTSDWHLGQYFVGQSRAAEHQAFFHWLKQQIIQLDADVLLVAGDIFDTATPPSYARELYHQLIVDLQPTGVQLVLLGGNHDSVAVLQESAALLQCLNTTVIPGYQTIPAAHLVPLRQKNGQVGAVLAAVPFLRPRDLSQRADGKSQPGQTAADKSAQLQQQISAVYQELYQQAQQLAIELQSGDPLPLLATGHLTTVGASSSESVREIYIGTLEALPASCLPPFAYIALGHIHQAQQVGGSEFIRYSGSPIALSFDEARQQKQLLLVEFSAGSQVPVVSAVDIPCFQPLLSLRTDVASLAVELAPALAQLAAGQQLWLELVLSGETALLSDLQLQLQQQLQDLPVQLLKLRRERQRSSSLASAAFEPSLLELTPQQVIESRLAQAELPTELQQRLLQLHQQALSQLTTEPNAAGADSTELRG